MTEQEILARVSAVIGEVLELDDLALDLATKASDVEDWDSIATVEIVRIVSHSGITTSWPSGTVRAM